MGTASVGDAFVTGLSLPAWATHAVSVNAEAVDGVTAGAPQDVALQRMMKERIDQRHEVYNEEQRLRQRPRRGLRRVDR